MIWGKQAKESGEKRRASKNPVNHRIGLRACSWGRMDMIPDSIARVNVGNGVR